MSIVEDHPVLPGFVEKALAEATTPRVERWNLRLRYAPDLEAVFDEQWRLPLTLWRGEEVVRAAVTEPATSHWALALFLDRMRPARSERGGDLDLLIPWFSDLAERTHAMRELERFGFLLLSSPEDDGLLLCRLFATLDRRGRLRASLYAPKGRSSVDAGR